VAGEATGQAVERGQIISTFMGPADPRWTHFLERTPHDFYHVPSYALVASKCENATPLAFYAEVGKSSLLLPLLVRSIPEYLGAPKTWTDAASPYGYAGPLLTGVDDPETLQLLLRAFRKSALKNNITSVFVRFHPLLNDAPQMFGEMGKIVRHGETVYVDLGRPAEEIWRDLKHGHRENIRKLRKLAFTVDFDSWEKLPGFISAYRDTMERVSATDFYRFPESYFLELREALGTRLHLCTVQAPNGEIASGSLFTLENGIAQDHLAATKDEYVRIGPSKLMTYAQMIWLKWAGATVFHLGGGVSSRTDSLFYFKAGFSKLTSSFWTCSAIIDQDKYTRLVHAAKGQVRHGRDDFFPAYRQDSL
jgi:Acetyltransferase (GNAT) domain